MKQISFTPSILAIFLLSILYWLYLAFHTQMSIAYDAINYQDLGRLFQTQGWPAYFQTGPNREPLYPLLIALSMDLEQFCKLPYTKIMAGFGILILLTTQILIYKILYHFNVRRWICILILAYWAVSPAINNSAFSLYSEIVTYPWILGLVLISLKLWGKIEQGHSQACLIYGGLLGLLFTGLCLIKAVFECIFPLYLMLFILTAFLSFKKIKISALLLAVLGALLLFYTPITLDKSLNKHYNGHFVLTNRGSWALYGNTARRMEPLTAQRFLTALSYAPGEGLCNSLFGTDACEFWSYRQSDGLGYGKFNELSGQKLSEDAVNGELLRLSLNKILVNPFQYALLCGIEGLKMFFWESTQIGFVSYPPWLDRLYTHNLFKNGLRLMIGLLSFCAVFYMWMQILKQKASPLLWSIGVLTLLYIFVYAFFFILTRYAFPIAPLFLVSIGIFLQEVLPLKK